MNVRLTRNAISAVIGGDLDLKPLVQVVEIKGISSFQKRFRLLLSDGDRTSQALLAAQLNDRVKSGALQKGAVVQLIEYVCSSIQNAQVIVILNLEIIIAECEIIGSSKHESELYSQNSPTTSKNSSIPKGVSGNWPSASSAPAFNPTVQPSYKPPPSYKSHGAISKNEAPARIIPISALNPYQGRWAIKARVTSKTDLRRYNNAKGDGKVFSFDLLDADGGEIRATCFNAAADRFFDLIKPGKIYTISKGNVKPAQKNFNHLDHPWEIFLDSSSALDLCPDDDSSIPDQQFTFKKIDQIESAENNSVLDLIGIVAAVGPATTILKKNGMETLKRTLSIKDETGKSVELTLWGEICNREGRELEEIVKSREEFPVLAIKAGRVNDFSGKTVSTVSSTLLFINPNLQEAHSLRDWFDSKGNSLGSQSISRDLIPVHLQGDKRKTVAHIREEGLGRGEKPDWVSLKATISFIKTDSFCYPACTLCGKKVMEGGGGRWCCGNCDKEGEEECDYRYLLQMQVQDHTGITWVTCFQESGEVILGLPAKDLFLMKNRGDGDGRFAEIFRSCIFEEYLLGLRIKEAVHGDERKVRITVVRAEKVDPSVESRFLLDWISKRF
ncbi:replication protein A 1A [Wolffia australiana]